MKQVGEAFFCIEGDASGYVFQGQVFSHVGRLWLATTKAVFRDGQEPIPEWLVPLDALGYRGPTDEKMLTLGTSVPRELVGLNAEPEALRRAGAVLNPVLAQHPESGGTRH